MSRPVLSLLAVAAVIGLGVGVATASPASDPADQAPPAMTRVPVSSATLVCPAPQVGPDSTTGVAVAAGVSSDGDVMGTAAGGPSASGAASLARLDGAPLVQVPPASGLLGRASAKDDGPLVVSASGSLAPGLSASLFTRTSNGELRGLESAACTAAGTDFWFVGSGAQVGRRGVVYLTNPSDAVAVADVTVFGPDGPLGSSATRGLAVAAHSQQVIQLDAVAPDAARLAVHVAVTQGRLSAAVRDTQVKGLDGLGADWVPPAAAPARRLVVPFVPGGGGGARSLQIVAPGETDAVVALQVVTSEGTFTPAGLESVDVSAGTLAEVDIAAVADADGDGVNDENLAVVLESDVPVTAGVLARRAAAGTTLAELAWTAAAAPVTGPALLPYAGVGGAVRSELMLVAPEKAGGVEVELLAADGRRTSQRVTLTAGTATTLALTPPDGAPMFVVVVRPDPGMVVYGARMLTERGARGPLLTIEPLRPAAVEVSVPRVVRDLSTGLRAAGQVEPQSSSSP